MVKEELEPIEDVLKFIENDLLDDNERYRFKQRRLSINQERWLKRIKADAEELKMLRKEIELKTEYIVELEGELKDAQAENKKLKKNQCHHHPMEIRDSLEVRAEMKRQDDAVKREGHWQG